MLTGKTVLVTGAGGSIGSALCTRLVNSGISRLRMLNLTEGGLYNVNRKLRQIETEVEIEPVLGSVTNSALVREALDGVDIVIHAAAHKHVPICESNLVEAVSNNVFGTETLLREALEAEVECFVLVSTDKAVKPRSVMGATKRVAELMVRKASANTRTKLIVVRFGNVLDSAGSVLPLWREQIAQGGPITLTDPRCERYFMSIDEACELTLGTIEIGESGTYVFDMGEPVKMGELAERVIAASGMPCDIEFIGLRQGEKITEELHFDGERFPTSHPKISRVEESMPDSLYLLNDLRWAALARNKQETAMRLWSMVE